MDLRKISSSQLNLLLEQMNLLLEQLSNNFRKISKTDLIEIINQENTYVITCKLRNDNKIMGLGLIYFMKTLSKHAAVIEDVIVDRDLRGKGLGKRIMQELIKVAYRRGVDFIDLTSNPKRIEANALYKKLGFKKRKTNCYRLDLKRRK